MKTVLQILGEIRPEFDFAESADFIRDGMLDSFDMMMLVAELDKNYSISIDGTDIRPEHFSNLQGIRTLLTKYGIE